MRLVALLFVLGAAVTLNSAETPRVAAAGPARIFRAGAANSNLTPPLGLSLDGRIGQRGPATGIHDELYARCLALDDGRIQVVFVIVDNTVIDRELFEQAKRQVHDAIGFPTYRILTAATHSHSTPQGVYISGSQAERDYHAFIVSRIADGIRRALNNLAPARVGWGSGRKPEFVFSRRWRVKPEGRVPNPFGETNEEAQMNPPPGSPRLIAPAGEVDPEVFVLSLQHADGRPLAVLSNYGLHYVGGTGGKVSADYFGAFADHLQQLLAPARQDPPFVGIMSNGTSGDVNSIDFSRRSPAGARPYERINHVAGSVAAEVQRVCQSIQYHSWVPLAMEENEVQLAVRRPSAERLAWAQKIWNEPRGQSPLSRKEVYARETLEVAKYPDTVPAKLQAIRVGTLGIAAAPCEVFASTGLQIKAQSPFPQTFTITLANGYNGYLPTPRDHELGGYETWLARSSYLEVQASEKIRDELLRLLNVVAREETR